MIKQDFALLKEIGLSEGQIAVYGAVLQTGIATLGTIQEKTGIERRNIYDILNKLIEKGLVSYTLEKGKRTYQCTHPNKVLAAIKEKEGNLRALEAKLSEMRHLFEMTRPEIRGEVYRGPEAIKTLLEESLEQSETYWIGGNSGVEKTSLAAWFTHWMARRAELKKMMYDLVSHGTFLQGLNPEDKKAHQKLYYQYRSLPAGFYTPLVILIFGDKVAQIIWSAQPFAFVIESPEVRTSFMKYFDYFWKQAR